MPTSSVADRVSDKLPRPVSCDCCGSRRVHLQKRSLMRLRIYTPWDLVWHCGDCEALVGCHEGTDIPLGRMADARTRRARADVHQAFDPLWKKGAWPRDAAYTWLAGLLGVPKHQAHIGMLDQAQCEKVIAAVAGLKDTRRTQPDRQHWKQATRKKRRN